MIKTLLVIVGIIISHAMEKTSLLEYPHYRVHYGRDATHGEFPYVVLMVIIHENIEIGFQRMCSGSMIAEQWTITAAHCVYNKPAFVMENSYIWYGNFTFSPVETNLYSKVLEIFNHPGSRIINRITYEKDFSLLRVSKINMKNYGILAAIDHTTLIGLPVTYVGGGQTKPRFAAENELGLLQVGEAAIIPCSRSIKLMANFLICIAPKCINRQHRPWFGDSGGPLIVDGKIVGVLSFDLKYKGVLGKEVMVPVGCAPVNPFLEWIYNTMHSEL